MNEGEFNIPQESDRLQELINLIYEKLPYLLTAAREPVEINEICEWLRHYQDLKQLIDQFEKQGNSSLEELVLQIMGGGSIPGVTKQEKIIREGDKEKIIALSLWSLSEERKAEIQKEDPKSVQEAHSVIADAALSKIPDFLSSSQPSDNK